MLCYQKIWQKWTLETLENIFQNEGFRNVSKVQTFLGSTDGGVPNLFLYPDSLLKQGGVTKIYFMNLRNMKSRL